MAASLNRHAGMYIHRWLRLLQRFRGKEDRHKLRFLSSSCGSMHTLPVFYKTSSICRNFHSVVERYVWPTVIPIDRHCPSCKQTSGKRCYSTSESEAPDNNRIKDDGSEKRRALKAKKEARKLLALERQKLKQQKKLLRIDPLYTVPTVPGEKKSTSCPLPNTYSPDYVEAAWYEWWEKSGHFSPESRKNKSDGSFSICLPPPNITGTLHLGHALGNSIQDSLARWHRMCGRKVLWLPGSDHAGIATQVVVEKKLWREQNKTRHEIGREAFTNEVWKWKQEKGNAISEQMRRLGSSLDWSREYFTLDPGHSYAVDEAFIRLHEEGLIYRSERLVNWSCALKSAISDIEVENINLDKKTFIQIPGYEKEIPFGQMTSFAYPVEGSDEEVIVSTTRLETMLGDVAVAVHPDDPRFTHLHGCRLTHPLNGASLPIICDTFVDKEFGSGAVKLTPAHDYTDNVVGVRHRLPLINVLDDHGRMINVPEQFLGKPRFIAREEVKKALTDMNLLRGVEDHPMTLPTCSRSGDVIEPLLKDQWYVDCDDMAKSALRAVESGHLELIPDRYADQWKHWLENTQNWCISRQLWWGHRIPVYRVSRKSGKPLSTGEEWVSAHSRSAALEKAVAKTGIQSDELMITQDEDVLDTWFSSAIIPFSSLGWPKNTADLAEFYPSHLLETASDILFFWVARMVMMGEKLTGQLPFRKVLLHSILRDSHGRKMSKSLGNIVDPMDVINGITPEDLKEKLSTYNLSDAELSKAVAGQQKDFPLGIDQCGADALHYTLCTYNFKNQFVNLSVSHIEANRRFCNKIWQAFRFCSQEWGPDYSPPTEIKLGDSASATDLWILSELSTMVTACQDGFETYSLNMATSAIYNFIWLKLCDVYLEYSKPVLGGCDTRRSSMVKDILYHCMSTSLRALAPFMPYLCEELYQRLPGVDLDQAPSVHLAQYPLPTEYPWSNNEVTESMDRIQTVINNILSIRNDYNLGKLRQEITLVAHSEDVAGWLNDYKDTLHALSRSASVDITTMDSKPEGCVQLDLHSNCTLYIKLQGLVDPESEKEKLRKRLDKLEGDRKRIEEKLAMDTLSDYTVVVEKDKLNKTQTEILRLNRAIESLHSMN